MCVRVGGQAVKRDRKDRETETENVWMRNVRERKSVES